MYIPKYAQVDDRQTATDIINEFGFGLIVSPTLEATHVPLVYQPVSEGNGVLYGHFAKANPHWKELAGTRVLIVFGGPHAYISPTWYENKPAVPTWNYVAVHCYGTVELLNDQETANALNHLIRQYEPSLLSNSEVMSDELNAKLSQAIVGFKIVIDDIQAKEKLGLHRSPEDQAGVYQALNESEHLPAKMLANYMNKRTMKSEGQDQ